MKNCVVGVVLALAGVSSMAHAISDVVAIDLRANPNRVLRFPVNAPANTQVATTTYDGFAIDFNANASVLYGITAGAAGTQTLGTIDTGTGAFSPIGLVTGGPDPAANYGGMSFDAVSNTMYVLGSFGGVSNIYTMNLSNGALSLVAPITGGAAAPIYIDIAIDNAGNMYTHDIGTDMMLSVNKATGAATVLGPTGFNANFAQGMDFDPATNILYAALYTGGGTGAFASINLVTGAATSIVSTTPWNAEMEIAITPAPGAFALLGLGGLMAMRRRR